MKILFFGFGRFQKIRKNPSSKIAKDLARLLEKSFETDSIILPSSASCWKILEKKIRQFKPEAIIGFGIASGRASVCIERIALNLKPSRKKSLERISPKKPLALEARVDIEKLLKAVKGIPTRISYYAGTSYCNFVYYNLLANFPKKSIFVLIPLTFRKDRIAKAQKPEVDSKRISNALKKAIIKTF